MPVDMRRNDAEQRRNSLLGEASNTMSDEPEYPQGLRMHLEEAEVQKLGLDFQAGQQVELEVVVKVVSVGQDEDGRSAQLQVVQMGKKPTPDEMPDGRVDALYGV